MASCQCCVRGTGDTKPPLAAPGPLCVCACSPCSCHLLCPSHLPADSSALTQRDLHTKPCQCLPCATQGVSVGPFAGFFIPTTLGWLCGVCSALWVCSSMCEWLCQLQQGLLLARCVCDSQHVGFDLSDTPKAPLGEPLQPALLWQLLSPQAQKYLCI